MGAATRAQKCHVDEEGVITMRGGGVAKRRENGMHFAMAHIPHREAQTA